ncbi:Aggregation promoting factor [Streptococcus sp. DD13]|nr:Aggregation promoting factor [Streptococcus sp. DD13]
MIYVGQTLEIDGKTKANVATSTNEVTSTVATQEEVVTPAAQTTVAQTASSQTTTTATQTSNTAVTGSEAAAKEEIARRESGGSYTATNGQYIGRYQLSASYLNGDYSAANQERVADAYVSQRYGSWTAALAFWNANGWY